MCLTDGEASLWQKWDQDVGLLAASPMSSVLTYHAPKHFPDVRFSPSYFCQSGEGILTIHLEICAHESLVELGMAILLPLLFPCHHTLITSFHAFV